MSERCFNPIAAAQPLSLAATNFVSQALRAQREFGEQLQAATARLIGAAYLAKIPEDVLESAIREHQGLVTHAFEAARAHVQATGELARGQYAGLVQTKVLPCSLLQSSVVEQALNKAQSTALQAVDKLEALRHKVVDPLGFPAPKSA
jgi:hypothetical protein